MFSLGIDAATSAGAHPPPPDLAQLLDRAAPPHAVKFHSFGDYELLEEIARGGMGVVFRARQISLRRPVAIKVILAGRTEALGSSKRFHLEAEATARLDHPNIVPVYETGEHQGHRYFSMKLLTGGSLAQRLARSAPHKAPPLQVAGTEPGWEPHRPMRPADDDDDAASTAARSLAPSPASGAAYSPRAAAQLLSIVARAVHYAHQRGVLHRDLKPSNILLDELGAPHVTDFGLARLLDEDVDLTQSGVILGTPVYMSPEQASGRSRDLTTACDLWSLGAILYEVLTGRPPFRRATTVETLRSVLEDEAPRAPLKSVDRDLQTICLKCLDKDPARRYASAAAFADDLDRWLRLEPILARRTTAGERLRKWSRRQPMLAAAGIILLLVLAAGISGVFWQWHRAEENARREAVQRQRAEAETARAATAEHEMRETLSSARLSEARARRASGQPGRRFQSLAAISNAAIVRPSLELRNEAIAALALVDAQPVKTWDRTAEREHLWFSPRLDRYAGLNEAGEVRICRVEDDVELTRFRAGADHATNDQPTGLRFSPDGQYLQVIRMQDGAGDWMQVWDLTRTQQLVHLPCRGADFSPSGRQLAVPGPGNGILLIALPAGTTQAVVQAEGRFDRVQFDPAGERLAAVGGTNRTELLVIAIASDQIEARLRHANGFHSLAWHPDGRQLAWCNGADFGCFLWDVAGQKRQQLSDGSARRFAAVRFSRRGDLFIAAEGYSEDSANEALLWELPARRVSLKFSGCMDAEFAPDDRALGIREQGGSRLTLWALAPPGELRSWQETDPPLNGLHYVAFNTSGSVLACNAGGQLRLLDANTLQRLATSRDPRQWSELPRWPDANPTMYLRALPDRKSAGFYLTYAEHLLYWPIDEDGAGRGLNVRPLCLAAPTVQPAGPDIPCTWRTVSDDGSAFLVTSGHRHAYLYDATNLTVKARTGPNNHFEHLALSPDNRLLAISQTAVPAVWVWNLATGRPEKELRLDYHAKVVFSPDAQTLVTSGRELVFWDVHSWQPARRLNRPAPVSALSPLTFNRDGRLLAVCLTPNQVQIMEGTSGRELATLEAPLSWPISSFSFNSDASLLAVASENRSEFQLWNLRLIQQQLAAMHLDWERPADRTPDTR